MALWQQLLDALVETDGLALGGTGVVVAALLVLALRVVLPRFDRAPLRGPFLLLAGHLAAVVVATFVPQDSSAWRTFVMLAVLLQLLCIGRAGFLLVVETFFGRRAKRPLPRIFRDILQAVVYAACILVVLRKAGAQLDALLTTSALLTAIVGLSAQDTLGNLFAGLSLQAQQPFAVGDWIAFGDGQQPLIGRVVEVNWRATKVMTLDDVEVLVPNGQLAKAAIRNFTKPTPFSRRQVHVIVPFEASPAVVREALEQVLDDLPDVTREPAPSLVATDFDARGVRWTLRYFTGDYGRAEITDGLVRERMWYALRRAGVAIAVPQQLVELSQAQARQAIDAEALHRREMALRRVDICAALPDAQLRELAAAVGERTYARGERIIREGEAGSELFIILGGEVAVLIGDDAREVEVARLGPGSFFGEMSLMTGAPRTAGIRAVLEAQLLVVDKPAFQRVVAASPDLLDRVGAVLAERQGELDAASSQQRPGVAREPTERKGVLLSRIRDFFSLN